MQTFKNIDEAVALGAPLFAICEAYALTYPPSSTKVDLATQCYDALFALKAGESLEQVVGYIRDVNVRGEAETHPASDKVRAELRELYARFYSGAGGTLTA